MNHALPTAELLAMKAEASAVLDAPFDDNLGERIQAMNTVKAIDQELARRAPRIAFDRAGHDKFMLAVMHNYEQGNGF
jgi:hypothetical protein